MTENLEKIRPALVALEVGDSVTSVSYTHLTLPTN